MQVKVLHAKFHIFETTQCIDLKLYCVFGMMMEGHMPSSIALTIRLKLKLSLFALYRLTHFFSADPNNFIAISENIFFLFCFLADHNVLNVFVIALCRATSLRRLESYKRLFDSATYRQHGV